MEDWNQERLYANCISFLRDTGLMMNVILLLYVQYVIYIHQGQNPHKRERATVESIL